LAAESERCRTGQSRWAVARFDPEKMAVYRLARLHSRAVRDLVKVADTRGYADLVGQLRRSAASIPANILEAAGEWRPGRRLHYLMIARGSTCESWAHTDTLVDFGVVTPEAIRGVRDAQGQINALLTATIRNLEDARIADPAARKASSKYSNSHS
jgi:four helix bundle protein